ncbi:hypothetical protein ACHAWU_005276 [Discostella pseudostelligera]|uniref:Uncharacterized protein n=1 Tax=Discostella pseudostelligera TaxID=259834 RepID=A0ABD3M3S3_9STRA
MTTPRQYSDLNQTTPDPRSVPVLPVPVVEATLVDESSNQCWCNRHKRCVIIGAVTIAVAVTAARVAINMTEYNYSNGFELDSFTSSTSNITWTEQGRPIVGNRAEDYLGQSVALSADGSILAIGAPGLFGGNSTGYVKLYMSSDGSRWKQIGSDIKGDITGDNFGNCVALSADGTTLAVGAFAYGSADDPDAIPGYVRVYSIIGLGGQIGQDIIGEAPADQFGVFVSLSGDGKTVAIGANGNDGNGAGSGHVRVYQMKSSESNWAQLGQDIDGETEYDNSGTAVSLSTDGRTVAIGSPYINDEYGTDYGKVRVFQFDEFASSWVQQGLDIVGDLNGDDFGRSVALSSDGKTLAIGATTYDDVLSPGYVKVYHLQDDDWKQIGNTITAIADKGYFGMSISLSEDSKTVAIGDYYTNENGADGGSVSVYQFDDTDSIWIQHVKINGEDTFDWFGFTVSLSADGNKVAVGSPNSGDGRGNVRVFKVDD